MHLFWLLTPGVFPGSGSITIVDYYNTYDYASDVRELRGERACQLQMRGVSGVPLQRLRARPSTRQDHQGPSH